MLPTSRNTTYITGVTPVKGNDLNDLQDQVIALNSRQLPQVMLADNLLEKLIGGVANSGITQPEFGGQNGANAPTLWAYTPTPGAAYLRAGSANNKIQIAPGTLMQKVSNRDGVTVTMVPFTFSGTEEFPAIANGATNPRVDLLQMKLAYSSATSTATATLSVKQGTAAASPTIPDPDAGFVPVGMAVVGSTWTSATAPTFGADLGAGTGFLSVHDLRMPLAVRGFRVDPIQFKMETAWALSSTNQIALSSSGTNKMYVGCQINPGRIVGIGIEVGGVASLATAPILGLMSNGLTGSPSTAFINGHTLSGGGSMVNSPIIRYFRRDFEAHHAPSAGPVIQESATNKIGVPIWTNGYRVPQDDVTGDFFGYAGVAFVNQPNASQIGGVTFYVAVGL